MKCFERLVLSHIKAVIPPDLDQHQFAYRTNRSTEDAVSMALHTALTHLEQPNTYVRMLFVDFSSAFNTIIPHKLVSKLGSLGLDSSICSWVLGFLTDRPQCVRIGNHTSSTLILNTGTPQGCVLSPLLFTLFTNDCTPTHSSNTIIKFADDTTIVGLISDGDERAYRNEVECLDGWCKVNDLVLNTSKTKEIVVDFRRTKKSDHLPLHISGAEVERVEKVKFLGVHITNHLTWSSNTSYLCMRAQQRLYFLRKLKQAQLPQKLLVNFYRSTIESILSHCMIVWYSSCTVSERKDLHRVVKVAGRIIGTDLPSLDSVHTSRLKKKASSISRDATHPGHCLFDLLPSGKRCLYTEESHGPAKVAGLAAA
ncbi:hypothetical protein NFI96_000890, partial [Prochilodus magdalenae]